MKMPKMKMPNFGKMFEKLCNPAKLYLVLASVSVVFYIITMNSYSEKLQEIHSMGDDAESHTYMGLMMQVVWTILWTSVLNYIWHKFPKHGTTISWVLVLLPFVLFFIFFFFGLFMLSHIIATASVHQSNTDSLRSNLEVLSDSLGNVHGDVIDHGESLEDVHDTVRMGHDTALMGHDAVLENRDAIEGVHQIAQDHQDALNALHKPSHPVVEHEGHDPNDSKHASHDSHGDSLFGL